MTMSTFWKSLAVTALLFVQGWLAADPLKQTIDFNDYTYDRRDQLAELAADEVRQLDFEAGKLRAVTEGVDSTRRTADLMTDLQAKKEVARSQVDVLKEAGRQGGEENWVKARDRAEESIEAYRGAYRAALARVRDEQKLIP